jgi:biopolymer transport protein ExbD
MSMRGCWIGLVGFVVACSSKGDGAGRGSGGDCEVILGEPARAIAAMREKYKDDAVKVATVIEQCVAPSGARCERVAKLVKAIPDMAPLGLPEVGDPQAACESMPVGMQMCLLPSYVLANGAQCSAMRAEMAKTAITAAVPIEAAMPACPEVQVEIGRDAVTFGRGGSTMSIARERHAIDRDAVETGLRELAKDCVGGVEISAEPATGYQDLITVMDLAMAAGFEDIGIAKPGGDRPGDPPAPSGPGGGGTTIAKAPVVIVTKTEVLLDGTRLAGVDDRITAIEAAIAAALKARAVDPAAPAGALVIQADASATYETIMKVITGARTAGFEDVVFAVKSK